MAKNVGTFTVQPEKKSIRLNTGTHAVTPSGSIYDDQTQDVSGSEEDITNYYNRLMAQAEKERLRGNEEKADDLEAQAFNYVKMNLKGGNKPKKQDFDGATKSDNYKPTKTEQMKYDSVPVNERETKNQTQYAKDDSGTKVDKNASKKDVSLKNEKKSLQASREQLSSEIAAANDKRTKAYKSIKERGTIMKVLDKDISSAFNKQYNSPKAKGADQELYELTRKHAGDIMLVGKDKDTRKVNGIVMHLDPERVERIKWWHNMLSGRDNLDEQERVFMDLWNGKSGNTQARLNDDEYSVLAAEQNADKEAAKNATQEITKKRRQLNSLAPKDTSRKAEVVPSENLGTNWTVISVSGGGAAARYAMHPVKDENGSIYYEGYSVQNNNAGGYSVNTQNKPIFRSDNSDFDTALMEFKTAMESNTGKLEGKKDYTDINEEKINYNKNVILGMDWDELREHYKDFLLPGTTLQDVFATMDKNGLVVDEESNTIMFKDRAGPKHRIVDPAKAKANIGKGATYEVEPGTVINLDKLNQKRLDKYYEDQLEPGQHTAVVEYTGRNIGSGGGKGVGGSTVLHKEVWAVGEDGNKLYMLDSNIPKTIKSVFSYNAKDPSSEKERARNIAAWEKLNEEMTGDKNGYNGPVFDAKKPGMTSSVTREPIRKPNNRLGGHSVDRTMNLDLSNLAKVINNKYL